MRKLTTKELIEYRSMDEDRIIIDHMIMVSNFFEISKTNSSYLMQQAREEVEKVEMIHRKYYLYSRSLGKEF